MSNKSGGSLTARPRSRHFLVSASLVALTIIAGCKPTEKPPVKKEVAVEPTLPTSELLAQLAGARIDQARAKLDQKRPAEALAIAVSALRADPASVEARNLAKNLLATTVWNLPTLQIKHRMPIDQIAFAAPSSLWVSLGGKMNTTVRWDLTNMQVEALLFPVKDAVTRSLVFGPQRKSVVIQRGSMTLLCNAQTLKPICDLGKLPDFVTPTATVVFSEDGLLVAHPSVSSDKEEFIVWHLRDVATGQILRTSEPTPENEPRPLASYLSREKLRVLRADGSVFEMPVSPVAPQQVIPLPEPAHLLNAQFSADGNAALTLHDKGPHERSELSVISYQDKEDGSLEVKPLTERFPWSQHPNIWNGLMSDPSYAPYLVEGKSLSFLSDSNSPIETLSPITASAFMGNEVIIGEESGCLTVYHLLPLPGHADAEKISSKITLNDATSLMHFSESLSGLRFDEKLRTFGTLSLDQRIAEFNACDFEAIHSAFPELDFKATIDAFKAIHLRSVPPEALLPIWDRLARADLTRESWPEILKLSDNLADNTWHQQLTAALSGKSSNQLAAAEIERVFASGDDASVLTTIQQAGDKGSKAATALALSLQSEHPEWIQACLDSFEAIPPFLKQIALTRAAWLKGQRAIALSAWPEDFPRLKDIREREDWDGWEQADFEPALEAIHHCVRDELLALELTEQSTPEQRKAVAKRLTDPETIATIGKPRFAIACMKAALAFSSHKEESETTFNLANTARNLGAPAEPCMRAEALALTAMGEYAKAHPIWIELITEHPLETQIPGDYAEAAYTAFENADSQQAMTILTTGMHRYPQDGNFALRAGWVALLTGNSERGYQFLQSGKRIGFPKEKEENAIALLTIAAAQTGFFDDARVYFNDLLKIDPAWAELKTLDSLDWPEELKSVLGQFMH